MLQKILLAFSLLLAVGCQKMPEGNICLVDADRFRLLCYDMEKDFDSDGRIKQDAVSKKVPLTSISDLNKGTYFDPKSWSNVQAWIRSNRDQCQR